MTLPERFRRHLESLAIPEGPVLVAVSGGPDSLALLDLLAGSGVARSRIHVAHVDHGIHPESGRVARAVEAAAARYGVPFRARALGLSSGASETTARTRRYEALEAMAREAGATTLFTAHHRDDQVETVLMRILRGSGPAGLAGMAARRGRICRPLLPFGRDELAAHAAGLGVEPWQDPANRDPRHLRSWIRHALLPALRERVPEVDLRILALAEQAAVDRDGWDALLSRLSDLEFTREGRAVSVAAAPLNRYDSVILRGLLGALGRRVGLVLGPSRAARVERLLQRGRSGAVAELGSDGAAELSFDRLRLFRGVAHPWKGVPVNGDEGRIEVGEWVLEWKREPAPGRLERNQPVTWVTPGSYLVRPPHAGDRIRPLGGTGRRLVVRCLQEARVARSRRAAWPVVESDGLVIWVPGACRSADRIPAPGTPALRLDAHLR